MNSLAMIISTTQEGILPSWIRIISAEHTNSLSAIGSINLPKLVTRLYFLAILPSSRSVRLAMIKIAKESRSKPFISKITKGTIKIHLKIVSWLGKFILLMIHFSYQIIFVGIHHLYFHKITCHQAGSGI